MNKLFVSCRDERGNPVCPVCEAPVPKPGAFHSRECYSHFLVAVIQQPGMIEMEDAPLDLSSMPWYGEHDVPDSGVAHHDEASATGS